MVQLDNTPSVEQLTIVAGIIAAIISALGAIISVVITTVMNRSLTLAVDARQTIAAQDLEALKTRLATMSERSRAQFSTLIVRRAEAIQQLYASAVDLQASWATLMRPGTWDNAEVQESLRREAEPALQAWRLQYHRSRILFPMEVCDSLDEFDEEMEHVAVVYTTWIGAPNTDDRSKRLHDAFILITEKIVPARLALEEEFRRLLGAVDAAADL